MTRQIINIGTGPDSYTGDNLRTAFTKVNDNFAQLYAGNVGANTTINVLTANAVSTNGNVYAGNVIVQYQVVYNGNISAPYFVGNGRYLTGVLVSANLGNLSIGGPNNLTISGSVAGNIVLDPAGDGNVSIVSDVIPGANVTYNLGSSTRQWKDLWLSNSTLYLGGFPVTVSNTGALSVNGSPVTSSYGNANVTAFLPTYSGLLGGTLSTVSQPNITAVGTLTSLTAINDITTTSGRFIGNGSGLTAITGANVNGTVANATYAVTAQFVTGLTGANVTTALGYVPLNSNSANTYSNANVAEYLPTYTGNIAGNIVKSGYTWIFSNTGTTTFPTGVRLSNARGANTVNFLTDVDKSFQIETQTSATSKLWNFTTDGNLTLPQNANINFSNGVSILAGITGTYGNANVATYLPTYTGNIAGNIVKNDYTWTFGTDGDLTLPRQMVFPQGTTLYNNGMTVSANVGYAIRAFGNTGGADLQWFANAASMGTTKWNAVRLNSPEAATEGTIVLSAGQFVASKNWEFKADGNLALPAGGVLLVSGGIAPVSLITSPAPYLSGFGTISSQTMTASGNISGAALTSNASITAITTISALGGLQATPIGNVAGQASSGSFTTITANGNLTVSAVSINNSATVGTTLGVTGNVTVGGNLTVTGNITGNVATTFQSTWTVPTGNSTQSFTVSPSETYYMWVDCNIPNGILVWNATGTVTNTNVPVVGAQYAWVYTGGGTPIDFTSIPNQFVGTANTIVRSSVAPSATTNRFDFGINNTSGGNVTVRYGWIAIS